MDVLRKHGIREDYFEKTLTKENALQRFKLVLDWADKNNRRPSIKHKDSEELYLGGVLQSALRMKRDNNNTWYPEYEQMSKERGYDWFDDKDEKTINLLKFNKVVEWANLW